MTKIQFGNYSDSANTINKTFTLLPEIQANVKEPCSLYKPTFILKYNADLVKCNYIYCEEFGRYYFINETSLQPGNLFQVECTCDVLESFKSEILPLEADVVIQENRGFTLLPDSNVAVAERVAPQTLELKGGDWTPAMHGDPQFVFIKSAQ